MGRTIRRLAFLVLVLTGAGAIAYALRPVPVAVETAVIGPGALRVTVDEDGRTRIRERYVVSAPLAGRLSRISLREGDSVTAGQTVLAAIDPLDPSLLDPRARAEAEARVGAAEASLMQAGANLSSADAALELAQSELGRLREAAAKGAAAAQELDRAVATQAIRAAERQATGFAGEIARFEVELARAALRRMTPTPNDGDGRFEIAAPVSGRVLRVIQESAAVVQAGAPLVEIGDPEDLELVVDVLSRDAVAIKPGAPALLEQWGGETPLHGRVRLIEPAAFTKISALGVEEQRVNVLIDIVDPSEARGGLGDGFRIEARIVVWEEPEVLVAPTGAMFRSEGAWAVFAVTDGRARVRGITVGRRNGLDAQVLSGLEPGEIVVVYPSDRVQEGVRVASRRGGPVE